MPDAGGDQPAAVARVPASGRTSSPSMLCIPGQNRCEVSAHAANQLAAQVLAVDAVTVVAPRRSPTFADRGECFALDRILHPFRSVALLNQGLRTTETQITSPRQ